MNKEGSDQGRNERGGEPVAEATAKSRSFILRNTDKRFVPKTKGAYVWKKRK